MKNEMNQTASSSSFSVEAGGSKKKTAKSKLLAWLGIGLCGLCCSLPFLGAVAGITFFTAIAAYLEMIAILALGLAAIFFAIAYNQKKKKKSEESCETSCDVDCGCSTHSGSNK